MTTPLPLPPPVPLPIDAAGFDDLIERVRRLLQRVSDTADRLVDNALGVARGLPAFLARRVVRLIEEFVELVRRLRALVLRMVAPAGNPARVWETGRRWVEDFAGPLSDQVGKIDPDHLAAGYEWEGRAADAYLDAAARQRAALTALQTIGGDLDTALSRLAIGICGFWLAIAAALCSAVLQMIGAAIAAASGAGAPAALVLATTTVATACAAIAGAAAALAAVVEWVSDAITTIRHRLADHGAFPDGAWPAPASTRFADASMTDGTPSDWTLDR
ncbi:hypothetical protein GCM10022251_73370 [Phytohabitans flavus]|uniref:ESX-1 secretion-associated protein EspA/EspE-like domain-containing protein n=1 Tax=Phytohabitans flavus TaxID=1076124 RepID=A0A6F8XKC9_9ACTN|nr:hypothetical protein [Phytohabitans flavus]BCB74270.1 hypothetical protein Pflav_006800 [Phytohabitans flavus]